MMFSYTNHGEEVGADDYVRCSKMPSFVALSQDMDFFFKEVFETLVFFSILGAPQPCPIDSPPTAAPLGS